MMKSYLNLIPIYAKVHRRENKMTRACILLAVFLITAMFGLADMYLQGEIAKLIQTNGGWHYRFSSPDSKTAEEIAHSPGVIFSGWHYAADADAGLSFGGQPLTLCGLDKNEYEILFSGKIAEGRYPAADDEIAVSSEMMKMNGIRIGDSLSLTRPDGEPIQFTVTGFFTGGENLVPGSDMTAALTSAALNALSETMPIEKGFLIQLSSFRNMSQTITAIVNRLSIPPSQLSANEALLSMTGQLRGGSSSSIYGIALVLSALIMLTCVFMISGSLNSNVALQTEFFGMIRCLGGTRKQIMKFVRREGLQWCITAIPAGIAAGTVVVWILTAVMRAVSPARLSHMPVFGISRIGILTGTLLGIFTVLMAARSPAKRAARVSPLCAVSGNAMPNRHFLHAANTRFFNIETALGLHHAGAGKKNFILMTGAFAICIVLFLSFSTLVDFMKNAMMPKPWTPELSIASEANTCSLSKMLTEKISGLRGVKRVYGRMFAYDVPVVLNKTSAKANLISYEENQFFWAGDSLLEGSLTAVKQGQNKVLIVTCKGLSIHAGDSITLSAGGKEQIVTIAGILSDSPLARDADAETIICSESTFTELTGQAGYTILDVQFENGAVQEDVNVVKSLFPSGVIFRDSFAPVQEQRRFYYAFSVLVYGFLSIIAVITVFHIMNTICMSAAANRRQYSALLAIGMTGRQLTKMLFAEAAAYAICGILAGCILGIPLHMAIYLSLITNFWGIPWRLPLIPLSIIVCTVLSSALFAVPVPARLILLCRQPSVH